MASHKNLISFGIYIRNYIEYIQIKEVQINLINSEKLGEIIRADVH